MTSQPVIFRAFLFIFFVPPTLDLKKKSRKSTNEKNLALPISVNGSEKIRPRSPKSYQLFIVT